MLTSIHWRLRSSGCRAGLAGWVMAVLAACAPDLNWREVRSSTGPWTALFPCRPVHQVRPVSLGPAALDWHLHTCEAGDWTYAVGGADVTDAARVPQVLQALREAAQAVLQGATTQAAADFSVPGMTPQRQAGRWTLKGTDGQGRRRQVELALAARGSHVVQAMVIGPEAPEAATQPFFEGLRLQP